MRKALVVGLNHYPHIGDLYGCVNDAYEVKNVLETNSDGSVNFDVRLIVANNAKEAITRAQLKDLVVELFSGDSDIALLYFAGHGHIETTGGYLCACDCERGDDGLSLSEVVVLARKATKIRNKIIVLDSCHSGVAGDAPGEQVAELTEGMTILTASTAEQYASEENGSGVFTTLFVDALQGAAANLVGNVTPGSVYAHIDQSLDEWAQRPVFKTNVKRFVSLRKVQAPIELTTLKRIPEFFPEPGYVFQLDPTFEPEATGRPEGAPPPNPANTSRFEVLQQYNRVNLVVPTGASKPNMWNAAIESKACRLTVLGEHYRRLVISKRI